MDYSDGRGLEVENQYVDETESSRVAGYPDFRKLIEVGGHLKAASRRLLVTCSRNQGSFVRPCASSGKMRDVSSFCVCEMGYGGASSIVSAALDSSSNENGKSWREAPALGPGAFPFFGPSRW